MNNMYQFAMTVLIQAINWILLAGAAFVGVVLVGVVVNKLANVVRWVFGRESVPNWMEEIGLRLDSEINRLDRNVRDLDKQIVAKSKEIKELRELSQSAAGVMEAMTNELELKAYKPSSDEKFLLDAEMSNNVSKIAAHTAKKTMEAGLTQIVPGLVRAAVAAEFIENEEFCALQNEVSDLQDRQFDLEIDIKTLEMQQKPAKPAKRKAK